MNKEAIEFGKWLSINCTLCSVSDSWFYQHKLFTTEELYNKWITKLGGGNVNRA